MRKIIERNVNIIRLYLLFSLVNPKEAMNEIDGNTGSIYLLILPEEKERKMNIHKNQIRKNFVLVSCLNSEKVR